MESDLLVGAGCVKRVRSAYFGLEAFGLAPMFTQFVQSQRIEVVEETEASIVMAFALKSRKWIFAVECLVGTDLPSLRPDVKTVTDPYSGDALLGFRRSRLMCGDPRLVGDREAT